MTHGPNWKIEDGRELWRGKLGGRDVRLLLMDDTALGLQVAGIGVVAMDLRDWYDAALFFAANSGCPADAWLAAEAWTRH